MTSYSYSSESLYGNGFTFPYAKPYTKDELSKIRLK